MVRLIRPPNQYESYSTGQAGDIAKEYKTITRLRDGVKHFEDSHREKAAGNRLQSVEGHVIASQKE